MGLSRLSRGAWAALPLLCCGCEERELGALSLGLRPDSPERSELPPRYDEGDLVSHHDSSGGSFRIHYTERGTHAIGAGDGDASGVPDSVETVAREYDAVLDFFRDQLGFAPPISDAALGSDNGGDGRFDVYLLHFPNRADGAFRSEGCSELPPRRCTGYMLQENDFDGRGYPSLQVATRVLASHELFHAVQSGYAAELSVVLSEGTAVWASETYDPALTDFEGLVGGYLARPERSLAQEPTSAADAFSYGAALFFLRLEEVFGRELVRALWEELARAPEPSWTSALARVLSERHMRELGEVFVEFARANLYTGSRADPTRSYARGADYPEVAEQSIALPFHDALVRTTPLSARYYVVALGEDVELAAELGAGGEDLRGLELALALERGGRVIELARAVPPERASLHARASDRVHVLLVDARIAGSTLHPALCVGAAAISAACFAEHVADAGGALAPGTPSAGPDGGAGALGADPMPAPAGWDAGAVPPSDGQRAEGCGLARAGLARARKERAPRALTLLTLALGFALALRRERDRSDAGQR